MNKILLLLVTLTCCATGYTQQGVVKGYIKDSATQKPLMAKVINMTGKKSVTTDNKGFFSLMAAPKDFIFISAEGYRYDTLNYTTFFIDTITLLLATEGEILPTVTIISRYTKYQLDSIQRHTDFEQLRGTNYDAIDKQHGPGFGLTINLDRFFKKKYRDKKKQEQAFNIVEESEYVDYRFSPKLVALYTGLKSDPLKNFIIKNRPTYTWLRQQTTNEDILYYINEKLKTSY